MRRLPETCSQGMFIWWKHHARKRLTEGSMWMLQSTTRRAENVSVICDLSKWIAIFGSICAYFGKFFAQPIRIHKGSKQVGEGYNLDLIHGYNCLYIMTYKLWFLLDATKIKYSMTYVSRTSLILWGQVTYGNIDLDQHLLIQWNCSAAAPSNAD